MAQDHTNAMLAIVRADTARRAYLEANGSDGSPELLQLNADTVAAAADYETKLDAHILDVTS